MQLTRAATSDEVVIVVNESRIDAAVAMRFKDRMRQLLGGTSQPVVIDMRAVQFLDSSGLGAIIALRKAMDDARPLTLLGLTPNVERVFLLTRMDSVFDIRPADPPTEEQAT